MTKRTIVAALAAALTLSACGDSTNPTEQIALTQAQAEDMMDALSAIGGGYGFSRQAAYGAGRAALLTQSIDETTPCPNGGTNRSQGTFTINDAGTQMSGNLTESYSACKATSSSSTLWTFNGAPNIVMNFTMSFNQTTGAFTMSGTQKGALDVASSAGSGRCNIDLSFNVSGNDTSASGTVTGTVCGRNVSETITE